MKTNKKSRFYVYKLIDPKNSFPFYIGKGTGNRINHHEQQKDKIYKTANHNNRLLKNKINKVLRESGRVRYQKHYTTNEQAAFDIEIALISKYGRRDNKTGILCNMTAGGEGVSGYKRSKQQIQKLKEAAHARCKKIDQYTKDGIFIKTWINYREVIKHIPKTDASSISQCCNNKVKSSGGYRWAWFNELLLDWNTPHTPHTPHNPHKSHKGKTVYQYTQEGKFIASFTSITLAATTINKSPNTITECCARRSKTAGGYYWSYDKTPPQVIFTIFQYDNKGIFIKEFVNTPTAANYTDLTKSQIQNAINNPTSMGGGFYWRRQYSNTIIPHIKEHTGKQVGQYQNNKLISAFRSIRQASKETGIIGVGNCISGRAKTAGGYIWKII